MAAQEQCTRESVLDRYERCAVIGEPRTLDGEGVLSFPVGPLKIAEGERMDRFVKVIFGLGCSRRRAEGEDACGIQCFPCSIEVTVAAVERSA